MTESSEEPLARRIADVEVRVRAVEHDATPMLRALRKQLSREWASAPREEMLTLAYAVLVRGDDVGRFIAYELVAEHPATMAGLSADELRRLGEGLSSWVGVDTFASYVAGPAWRGGRVRDAEIARWARSADRWWRRAALVSTVPLNNRARGGTGDPERTLRVCAMLVADRDPMVWKALSWALREVSKRDADAVRRFLAAHEAALPRPVLREVRTKLATGTKRGW
jgi:3-methyladenine DNA glycosylase AlkD